MLSVPILRSRSTICRAVVRQFIPTASTFGSSSAALHRSRICLPAVVKPSGWTLKDRMMKASGSLALMYAAVAWRERSGLWVSIRKFRIPSSRKQSTTKRYSAAISRSSCSAIGPIVEKRKMSSPAARLAISHAARISAVQSLSGIRRRLTP